MINVVLFGAPGSGKGTQGELLAASAGVPKISTGDLLRAAVAAGSPLGKQAQAFMDGGLLVPDDVILGLIEEKLSSAEAAGGVIMDGFPRTIAQAREVDEFLLRRGERITAVVAFEVPDDELVQRMMGRASEMDRSDDTPEAIRKRLEVYQQQTAPLLQYYAERNVVSSIDGTGAVNDVAERVAAAVE